MQATILIKLGNDAMQSGPDVARALRSLAERLDELGELSPDHGRIQIRDDNGNVVGGFGVRADD